MRIALVTPEWPGCSPAYGVGAYIAVLARALRGAGHEVLGLVVNGSGRWLVDADGPRRIASQCGPAVLRPRLARAWLRSELGRFSPQVVECSNWGGLGGGLAGSWRRAVRLSTPVSAIPAPDPARWLIRCLHHRAELATVREADVVIADSAAMAELGRVSYGRSADAIVPHAWDGACSQPDAEAGDVLFVGRLEPRKGIDSLLAAWASVHRRHPRCILHVVGAERHGHGAACLARHGAAGVVLHGRLDDAALAALRHRCVIQAVPSRFESFGMVVLEAWAAGLAVVATAGGALPEVVGDAGLVVPVGDAAALAEAIMALIGDPGRRMGLASLGRLRLQTRFVTSELVTGSLTAYAGP